MEILCCMHMAASNVVNHLTPLVMHPNVKQLIMIRRQPLLNVNIPKSVQLTTTITWRLFSLPLMFWRVILLSRTSPISAIVSFNPFPYGLMALIAAKLWRKPVHLGFVGSDWYKSLKTFPGHLLLPFLRRADFFTCTGTKMREDMISRGFLSERIAVLPHSIDLTKASVADPHKALYDCVFVGYLTGRKRVDTILRAIALVVKRHPLSRLCVVGEGPVRDELEELTVQLGVKHNVEFAGQSTDVFSYLQLSRISIIASNMEGFPFATVEAICCGLVPVCTPVGTIPDFINDGETGMLFPIGDHEALANCILKLLDNPELYNRIRTNVLALREQFSYERATAVWDRFLRSVEHGSRTLNLGSRPIEITGH